MKLIELVTMTVVVAVGIERTSEQYCHFSVSSTFESSHFGLTSAKAIHIRHLPATDGTVDRTYATFYWANTMTSHARIQSMDALSAFQNPPEMGKSQLKN